MNKLVLLVFFLCLSGCAHAPIKKIQNPVAETKMSATMFLEKVRPSKRTAFVVVQNLTQHPEMNALQENVRVALAEKGYRFVEAPESAHYVLRVNIVQVGELALPSWNPLFRTPYGVVSEVQVFSRKKGDWQLDETRLVSTTTEEDIDVSAAQMILISEISRSIAGFF